MRDQTGIFSFHCAHSYSLRQVFEAKGKQNAILLRCGKEKTIALLNEVVMDELLKNISIENLEKLKVLISFLKTDDIKSSITIRFFKEEYLNYAKRNLSPAYYSSILLTFNKLTDITNEQRLINSLSHKEIESFVTDLQEKVKKGYPVYYRNLKAAFNKAKEWNYISENYFTKVKLPKKQKLAPTFINSDELQRISDKIKKQSSKRCGCVCILYGYETG